MVKNWAHVLVLLCFVFSTMPGLAFTHTQMLHEAASTQSAITHSAHKPHKNQSHKMAGGPSCCEDEKLQSTDSPPPVKQCCDGSCKCMMPGCAKLQAISSCGLLPYGPLNYKVSFFAENNRMDSIAPLLSTPPPKA